MGLIGKIKEKYFSPKKDEISEFLQEVNDSLIKRAKFYGFNSIEEYELAGQSLYNHQFNRSNRYPVTCDC